MNRSTQLQQLKEDILWNMVVIGGGATGLGIAVDAASRGYKVLLVEQSDFGKGTSSRSTKLVHGGVRYLEHGNIKLVKEALRERGWLLKNAPHLTSVQAFIIPVRKFWQKWYYGLGLKLYDLLSGTLSLGQTKLLSAKETMELLPALDAKKVKGGVLYYDGQFDDSRLCIDLASTAVLHGATVVNYCKVTGLVKEKKKITAVKVKLHNSEEELEIKTKSVINATGVFTDHILRMDDPAAEQMVDPSQGIHLVVDKIHFPGTHALMIPKTDDKRVLFAVPWLNKVVIGTTDTAVDEITDEPLVLEEEVDYILEHLNRYIEPAIDRSSILSVFAGLRPLVRSKEGTSTALLSRDHTIVVSTSGLVTITGGKWTTYRKMAQEAVDNAVFVSKQDKRLCITKNLPIGDPIATRQKKDNLVREQPALDQLLHPDFEYKWVDVVYAVQHEMAITVEDVLARRTRILFLDAKAAMDCTDIVINLMRETLGESEEWAGDQRSIFLELAEGYL
ncbi:MAG: FAD-dependent oxidoreductase [Bacteroidota bacterium]